MQSRQAHTLRLTISNPRMRNAVDPKIYLSGMQGLPVAEISANIPCVFTGEASTFFTDANLQHLLGVQHANAGEGIATFPEKLRPPFQATLTG